MNREFWKNSAEPEVRLLQAELQSRSFQGLISLHTDDTSAGFYGFARGATLTKNLIQPALAAAEKFLPRDERSVIDGFPARAESFVIAMTEFCPRRPSCVRVRSRSSWKLRPHRRNI
ncbi:MAG: hypothetical protein WDN00_11045 [Limisphaerales bacterium]